MFFIHFTLISSWYNWLEAFINLFIHLIIDSNFKMMNNGKINEKWKNKSENENKK